MGGDWTGFIFSYMLLGSVAGVLSGLFGIGGGIILVPVLSWLYTLQGISNEQVMIMAVATSLGTIVFTSVSSAYAHHRHQAVRWNIVARLAPGLLTGSVVGSVLANSLPAEVLRVVFAVFLIIVTLEMWVHREQQSAGSRLVKPPFLLVGSVIGMVSAVLGIGGGTLTVPYLVKCKLSIHHAVAVSSACGLPIASFGALTYLVLGWNNPDLPENSLGYIYMPALIGVISASFLCAPIGAKLAHKLATRKLKKIFAAFICIVGIRLLWS